MGVKGLTDYLIFEYNNYYYADMLQMIYCQ